MGILLKFLFWVMPYHWRIFTFWGSLLSWVLILNLRNLKYWGSYKTVSFNDKNFSSKFIAIETIRNKRITNVTTLITPSSEKNKLTSRRPLLWISFIQKYTLVTSVMSKCLPTWRHSHKFAMNETDTSFGFSFGWFFLVFDIFFFWFFFQFFFVFFFIFIQNIK